MKRPVFLFLPALLAALPSAFAAFPAGTDANRAFLQLGCLDVTQAPNRANPTGRIDSTQAIPHAINAPRGNSESPWVMVANIRHLGEHPMLAVVDAGANVVSQLKAFRPSTFPHPVEPRDAARNIVLS